MANQTVSMSLRPRLGGLPDIEADNADREGALQAFLAKPRGGTPQPSETKGNGTTAFEAVGAAFDRQRAGSPTQRTNYDDNVYESGQLDSDRALDKKVRNEILTEEEAQRYRDQQVLNGQPPQGPQQQNPQREQEITQREQDDSAALQSHLNDLDRKRREADDEALLYAERAPQREASNAALTKHLSQYDDDPVSQALATIEFRENQRNAKKADRQKAEDEIANQYDDPVMKALKVTEYRTKQRAEAPVRQAQEKQDELERIKERNQMQADIEQRGYGNPVLRETRAALERGGASLVSTAARLFGDNEAADQLNREIDAYGEAGAKARGGDLSPYVSSQVGGIAESIAKMAAIPGGTTAKAIGSGFMGANKALTEAEDAGVTGVGRLRYAATQGGVETAFALLGNRLLGPGVEGRMLGKAVAAQTWKQLVKNFGKDIIEELPEEVFTTAFQAASSKLEGVNPNMTLADFAQQLADTVVQTVGMSAVVNVPNAARIATGSVPPAATPPVNRSNRDNLTDEDFEALNVELPRVKSKAENRENDTPPPLERGDYKSYDDYLNAIANQPTQPQKPQPKPKQTKQTKQEAIAAFREDTRGSQRTYDAAVAAGMKPLPGTPNRAARADYAERERIRIADQQALQQWLAEVDDAPPAPRRPAPRQAAPPAPQRQPDTTWDRDADKADAQGRDTGRLVVDEDPVVAPPTPSRKQNYAQVAANPQNATRENLLDANVFLNDRIKDNNRKAQKGEITNELRKARNKSLQREITSNIALIRAKSFDGKPLPETQSPPVVKQPKAQPTTEQEDVADFFTQTVKQGEQNAQETDVVKNEQGNQGNQSPRAEGRKGNEVPRDEGVQQGQEGRKEGVLKTEPKAEQPASRGVEEKKKYRVVEYESDGPRKGTAFKDGYHIDFGTREGRKVRMSLVPVRKNGSRGVRVPIILRKVGDHTGRTMWPHEATLLESGPGGKAVDPGVPFADRMPYIEDLDDAVASGLESSDLLPGDYKDLEEAKRWLSVPENRQKYQQEFGPRGPRPKAAPKASPVATGVPSPDQSPKEAGPVSKPPVRSFETEKGSKYEQFEDGTTQRNKAKRDDVGHEGDSGEKKRSVKTVYVDSNAAALSAAGVNEDSGGVRTRVILRDGKATLLMWNTKEGRWGASPSSRDIAVHTEPAVGRYPLELWSPRDDVPGYEAYGSMHAGNKIVRMSPDQSPKEAGPVSKPEPSPETAPAAKPPVPQFTELTPAAQALFNQGYEAKDPNLLAKNNVAYNKEFENRTGIKLPNTVKGRNQAVADWAASAPAPAKDSAKAPEPQATTPKAEPKQPDLEIPKFNRTTADKGSISRTDRDDRVRQVRESVTAIEPRIKAKQKEYDGYRSNATKKRATAKSELNNLQSRKRDLEQSIRRDELQSNIANLEDAMESPRSYDHYLAGMMAIHQANVNLDEGVYRHQQEVDKFRDELLARAVTEAKAQGLNEFEADRAASTAIAGFSVLDDRPLSYFVERAANRIREDRIAQPMGKLFPNPNVYRGETTKLSDEQRDQFAEQLREATKDDENATAKISAINKKIDAAIQKIKDDAAAVEKKKAEVAAEEKATKEQEELKNARERAKKYFETERINKALKNQTTKPKPVFVRQEKAGGPVKIVEGERTDGDKKGELYPNGLMLHPSFGEDSKDFAITDKQTGLGFPSVASKSDMKSLIGLIDTLGIDFNGKLTKDGTLPDGLASRMRQVLNAWDTSDYSKLDEQDRATVEKLAAVAPTDIQADLILTADDLGANGIPPGMDKVMTDRGVKAIKQLANEVAEFAYDPVFTVQDGKLVYRDGYTFKFNPQVFNVHPSELTEGQTVGINLEDMGIARSTPQDVVADMLKKAGLPNVKMSKSGRDVTAGYVGASVSINQGKEDNDWSVVSGNGKVKATVIAALEKIRWRQPGQTGEASTEINEGSKPAGDTITAEPKPELAPDTARMLAKMQAEKDTAAKTRESSTARKTQQGYESLPEKTRTQFDTAWDKQDRDAIKSWLGMENKSLRAEFERRSGVKLPNTVSGTRQAIDDYFSSKPSDSGEVTTPASAEPVAQSEAPADAPVETERQKAANEARAAVEAQKAENARLNAVIGREFQKGDQSLGTFGVISDELARAIGQRIAGQIKLGFKQFDLFIKNLRASGNLDDVTIRGIKDNLIGGWNAGRERFGLDTATDASFEDSMSDTVDVDIEQIVEAAKAVTPENSLKTPPELPKKSPPPVPALPDKSRTIPERSPDDDDEKKRGINRAKRAERRDVIGVGPEDIVDQVGHSFPELDAEAKQVAPGYAEEVFTKIGEGGEAADNASDRDVFVMLNHIAGMQMETEKTQNALEAAQKAGDDFTVVELEAKLNVQVKEEVRLMNIAKSAGTAAGRALAAFKALLKNDMSLARLRMRLDAAADGNPTDAQAKALNALHAKFEAAVKDLEAKTKAADENLTRALIAEQIAKEMQEKAGSGKTTTPKPPASAPKEKTAATRLQTALKELRRSKIAFSGGLPLTPEHIEVAAAYIEEKVTTFKDFMEKLTKFYGRKPKAETLPVFKQAWDTAWENAKNQKPSTPPEVSIEPDHPASLVGAAKAMFRHFLSEGITNTDAVIDAVHNELQNQFPDDIGERLDTMKAIVDYDKIRTLSKDPLDILVADKRAVVQMEVHIARMKDGMPPNLLDPRHPQSDEQRNKRKEVNEEKRKGGFTVTDPERQAKSALASIETGLRHAISDTLNEIANKARTVPNKTASPTSDTTEDLKAYLALVQGMHKSIFGDRKMTQEQRLKAAEAAAVKNEAFWNDRLARAKAGDFTTGKPTTVPLTSDTIETIKARTDAAKAQIKELNALANPKPDPKIKAAETAAAKNLEYWNDRLVRAKAGDFSTGRTKPNPVTSANIAAIKAQSDLAKAQAHELQELAKPKKDPDAISDARYLTSLQNQQATKQARIADITARAAAGDFTPERNLSKEKREANALRRKDDASLRDARIELDKTARDLNELIEQTRLSNLTYVDLAKRVPGGVISLARDMAFGGELSFILKQGAPHVFGTLAPAGKLGRAGYEAITGNTDAAKAKLRQARQGYGKLGRALAGSLKAFLWKTDTELARSEDEIKQRPGYKNGMYKAMGVPVEDGGTLTVKEEVFLNNLVETGGLALDKIFPGFKGFRDGSPRFTGVAHNLNVANRFSNATKVFMSTIRADIADNAAEVWTMKRGEMTPAEARSLGRIANIVTGKGDMKSIGMDDEQALDFLGRIFISAPWLKSRFDMLMDPVLSLNPWSSRRTLESRKIAAEIYVDAAAGVAAYYGAVVLAAMFYNDDDDEKPNVEWDNTSSDFMKPRFGKTRIDPLFGLQQLIVMGSRMYHGTYKDHRGDIQKREGNSDLFELGGQFLKGRLHPWIQAAAAIYTQEDFNGQPITTAEVLKRMPIPVTYPDIVEASKNRGIPASNAFGLWGFIGGGLQTNQPRTKDRRDIAEELRYVQRKIDNPNTPADMRKSLQADADTMLEAHLVNAVKNQANNDGNKALEEQATNHKPGTPLSPELTAGIQKEKYDILMEASARMSSDPMWSSNGEKLPFPGNDDKGRNVARSLVSRMVPTVEEAIQQYNAAYAAKNETIYEIKTFGNRKVEVLKTSVEAGQARIRRAYQKQ